LKKDAATRRAHICIDRGFMIQQIVGVLRQWDATRGFGFIRAITKSGLFKEYFLHASNIETGDPEIGSYVIFSAGELTRGTAAPALNARISAASQAPPR
jgi:cold shock CspA family protein